VYQGGAGPDDGAVARDQGRAFAVPASAPERAADLCVLSVGLMLGAAGAVALFAATLAADDAGRIVAAVGVYAVVLPAMFLCALFYAAAFGTPRGGFLRRLDHAAIFALIAATATPFAVAQPVAGRGRGAAAIIWAVAAVGIFVKLRFPIGRASRSAAVYGLSAWAVMILVGPTIASRRALLLLFLGGTLYTIGIGFHLWRRLRFRRAIWHSFVIAGAIAHYFAVAAIVL
jgi:hemolysin III